MCRTNKKCLCYIFTSAFDILALTLSMMIATAACTVPGDLIGQAWTGARLRASLKEPPVLGWERSEMQRTFCADSCSRVKAPTLLGASTDPRGNGPTKNPASAKAARASIQRAWSCNYEVLSFL